MGDVIHISERIADRSRPVRARVRFFFALDDPFSYLTAERVERALGAIEWVPVLGPLSERGGTAAPQEREFQARERMLLAERDARALELPLVEPHRYPMDSRKAARAATFACERGNGAAFTLALLRLAFCGGFDIASYPVIGEAAAVAGLDPDAVVDAARDQRIDMRLDATSRGLSKRGVKSPPAISVGAAWFEGPTAMIAAVSFSATQQQPQADAPVLPAS